MCDKQRGCGLVNVIPLDGSVASANAGEDRV